MRNYKKNKAAIWIVIAVVILLVSIFVLDPFSLVQKLQKETGVIDDKMIFNISEQNHMVIVATEYGKIQYSFAMSDVIRIVPIRYSDHASFEFRGILGDEEALLYTLWIGKDQGTPAGFATDRSGNLHETYFEMAKAPKGLQESDRNTFYAAQETINDVLSTFITHS